MEKGMRRAERCRVVQLDATVSHSTSACARSGGRGPTPGLLLAMQVPFTLPSDSPVASLIKDFSEGRKSV